MASAVLSTLYRADGSATYKSNGSSVIASVNGPIEVQRRDELPEEAAIDVAARPATGVGGLRERHLEAVIQNTLRRIILVSAHPRTLIQFTLQITETLDYGSIPSNLPLTGSTLPILSELLQASMMALLATSIPLTMTLSATYLVVDQNHQIVFDPSPQDVRTATSMHVFAFSSDGDLLVNESGGEFEIDIWEEAYEKAKLFCLGTESDDSESEDTSMNSKTGPNLQGFMNDVVRRKVAAENKWKENPS